MVPQLLLSSASVTVASAEARLIVARTVGGVGPVGGDRETGGHQTVRRAACLYRDQRQADGRQGAGYGAVRPRDGAVTAYPP